MKYDFDTMISRRGMSSSKYEYMLEQNPHVGEDVVPFSAADMEWKNPPELTKGLQEYIGNTLLGYRVKSPAYLAAVCGWMERRHGWRVPPAWVLEWNGVGPALHEVVAALLVPGEGAIIMPPVYGPYYIAIEGPGRTVVENPLLYDEVTRRYTIDFDDLEAKAKQPQNKLLLLCSPHNPIGRVWSREELGRLGRICIDNGVLVLSDEIHFDFVMPGHTHTVFAAISEEFAVHSIICTGPGKSFNMAGLQTANLIVPDPALRHHIERAHFNNGFFSQNNLAYQATEIVYTQCEAWLDQMLLAVKKNRDFVEDYIARHLPAIHTVPLEGTYLQWLDCRGLGLETQALEHFMQREAEVFFTDGSEFGPGGAGFERFNLACPTPVLRAGLDRLRSAIRRRGLPGASATGKAANA